MYSLVHDQCHKKHSSPAEFLSKKQKNKKMLEISVFAQIEMNWWGKNAVSYFDMKKGRETDSVHFTGNRELGSHL